MTHMAAGRCAPLVVLIRSRGLVHWLMIGVGAAAAILLTGGQAMAAAGGTGHTVTMTEHQHGTFTDDQATNPCTGAPGVATFDGNSVEHVTFFPAGTRCGQPLPKPGRSPSLGRG